jgi:hypothetical protein
MHRASELKHATTPRRGGAKLSGEYYIFAGVPEFLGNAKTFFEEANQADREWEAFLVCVRAHLGDTAFTSADLIRKTERKCLSQVTLDLSNSEIVGKAFARRNETRFGASGIHIRKCGTTQHVTRWQVVAGVSVG